MFGEDVSTKKCAFWLCQEGRKISSAPFSPASEEMKSKDTEEPL